MIDQQIAQLRVLLDADYPSDEKVYRAKSMLASFAPRGLSVLVEECAIRGGVTLPEVMNMKCRHKTVLAARRDAWHVMRYTHRMTLEQIATEFGTTHSTVSAGIGAHIRELRRK